MRTHTIAIAFVALAALAGRARAQDVPTMDTPPGDAPMDPAMEPAPPEPTPADATVTADASATVTTDEVIVESSGPVQHAVTVAVKAGGLFPQPFGELGTSYLLSLEVGYWFALKRRLGVTVEVGYTAPRSSGTASDARVPGGSYDWDLQQRELILGASLLYRLPLGKLTVYGGIGPRIFLLDSQIDGSAGAETISKSTEQSTKLGIGVPIGAGFRLGPGDLLAELLLDFSSIDHKVTGDANTGALSFSLGYRFGF